MRITNGEIFGGSMAAMSNLQQAINSNQAQVSSGNRLTSASVDPVAAAQSITLSDQIGALAQYTTNSNAAMLTLQDQQTALTSVQSSMEKVRETVLQAQNPSLSLADRKNLAALVGQQLGQILSQANTQNASNEYIFSGTAVQTKPFSTDATGNVVYNGNQNAQNMVIAENRTVGVNVTGSDVFMAVPNGNGTFLATAGAANAGTGQPVNEAVTNAAGVSTDSFSIQFSAASTYNVIDTTTGTTIAIAQPYTDGAPISFNGISLGITGAPVAGDTFQISPSQNQSVFTTLSNVQQDIAAVSNSPQSAAQFSAQLANDLNAIDNAMSGLTSTLTTIGARQNAIQSQLTTNSQLSTQLQTMLSNLQDTNTVQAVSQLAQETQALQAAQQTFVSVQGLSLFNYIKG